MLPAGRAPLIVAAETGSFEIVKLLVGEGASVEQMNAIKATPLFAAASNGHSQIVNHLISAKADLNCKQSGFTILYVATANKHPDTAQALLDAKADVNARSSEGQTRANSL